MEELRTIYWHGLLEATNMMRASWLEQWIKAVRSAEVEGFQLAVFKIPSTPSGSPDPEALRAIEQLLQDKYGTQKLP